MFHLAHKPLTTPSFFLARCALLSVFFFLPFSLSLSLHPGTFCLSLIPVLCSSSYWGTSSRCSNFTCCQISLFLHLSVSACLSISLLSSPQPPSHNPLVHFHELLLFPAALKAEGNGDEERRAGPFPFATYLRVMGLRKSDPREFVMRITNPTLLECCHLPRWPLGGGRGASMTEVLKWSWI